MDRPGWRKKRKKQIDKVVFLPVKVWSHRKKGEITLKKVNTCSDRWIEKKKENKKSQVKGWPHRKFTLFR